MLLCVSISELPIVSYQLRRIYVVISVHRVSSYEARRLELSMQGRLELTSVIIARTENEQGTVNDRC